MPNNEPLIYSFKQQPAIGLAGEAVLDRYFHDRYIIKNATAYKQKVGIVRHFQCKETNRVVKVEFKTDYQAHRTGNAFVETVSLSRQNEWKQGRAYTCEANLLIYFCYHLNKAYVIEPKYLRNIVERWKLIYGEKRILNNGWITSGIPVPLCKFRLAALQVLRIEVQK